MSEIVPYFVYVLHSDQDVSYCMEADLLARFTL